MNSKKVLLLGSASMLGASAGFAIESISPWTRAWMWCRRNRKVAAFLAALSLFAGVSTWQWLRAEDLRHQAEHNAGAGRIDQALALCSQGEVGRGLLALAETLQTAPSGSDDLRRVIRANIGDIGHFLNAGGVADSPLRNKLLRSKSNHASFERSITVLTTAT